MSKNLLRTINTTRWLWVASLLLTLIACTSQQQSAVDQSPAPGQPASDATGNCTPEADIGDGSAGGDGQPGIVTKSLPDGEPAADEPGQPWPTPACPEPRPCPVCPAAVANKKAILGEYEYATVDPPGFKYLARIDTGATSSSIHATEVTRFERDGRKWVRFTLHDPENGETVTLERKLKRRVRIKQAGSEDDRRLTVTATIKIGTLVKQIEVTLSDRTDMEFPMLIGRNFLIDMAVVDVSFKRVVE